MKITHIKNKDGFGQLVENVISPDKRRKVKTKYQCFSCGGSYKTKKSFIEHLKDEFEDATDIADTAVGQLEELGIENLY